ncbi:MAG: DUF5320 domain-containing protein [Candidatus Electryonea clarkiae]|nr:DUF5320 domain-containing protein [Candidatus Electryonea clarkiae]
MPARDGTGPIGNGPRTRRGFGGCIQSYRQNMGLINGNQTGLKTFTNILFPLSIALITELLNPNSALRKFNGRVTGRITAKKRNMLLKP